MDQLNNRGSAWQDGYQKNRLHFDCTQPIDEKNFFFYPALLNFVLGIKSRLNLVKNTMTCFMLRLIAIDRLSV